MVGERALQHLGSFTCGVAELWAKCEKKRVPALLEGGTTEGNLPGHLAVVSRLNGNLAVGSLGGMIPLHLHLQRTPTSGTE